MERRSFQLTLVRHGETEENRLGIIQGQADVPLNDTGRQQARLAAEKLACETFTSVYSSDLIRVKETADTIVSRLPEKMDIVTDRRLREKCFGVMEGVNYSDLIAEGKLAGVKSILHYTPPGAETIDEFTSRAMDFFCEICNQSCSDPSLPVPSKSILSQYLANKDGTTISSKSMPSRHVLVATHGGIIISLISMFLVYLYLFHPALFKLLHLLPGCGAEDKQCTNHSRLTGAFSLYSDSFMYVPYRSLRESTKYFIETCYYEGGF